jgi:hypothetical protein
MNDLRWLIAGLLPTACAAQEHPYLSHFTLDAGYGTIELSWEMIAGNTCDGITILRGTDSLDLAPVGNIAGICGSIGAPVPFHWTDADPLEFTTLYYRLRLGVNGYSSVQAIAFDQLTRTGHRVLPNPAIDAVSLVVRTSPTSEMDLMVRSLSGRVMREVTGHHGHRFDLDVSSWPAGTYLYEATTAGDRFTGSFVVVH